MSEQTPNPAQVRVPALSSLAQLRVRTVELPAMRQAMALSEQLASLSRQTSALSTQLQPLASSLARASRSLDRVEAKRRRVVCKLGRRAANRSDVLAALEELSLEALEQLLDSILEGRPIPAHLSTRLAVLTYSRAEVEQAARRVRGERRAYALELRRPERRPRLEQTPRKPHGARTFSRPVGSLAPPQGRSTSIPSLPLPRGVQLM